MSIPILMFHQVAQPPASGAPYRSLTVAPARFRRHMAWLRTLGWHGLSMHGLAPYLRGDKTGRVFGLTFDDAYLNVHTHALPVLQALAFTATTYVVAGAVGRANVWDVAEGVAPSPLMAHGHLQDWLAAGCEIGAHGWDHVHLTRLDAGAAHRQIVESRLALQAEFQQSIDAFCYPYGDYNAGIARSVREAGYTSATTTRRGRANGQDDPYALPRVHVLRHTPSVQVVRKCLTQYEDRRRLP